MTTEQIKAIADQFVAIAVKHGGEIADPVKGTVKFPTKEAKAAFLAEYEAAPSVI